MRPAILKDGEIIVSQNEFGWLVEEFIRGALRRNRYEMKWLDETIRRWWPQLDSYNRRHIITNIEVEILMNTPPRTSREPLEHIEVWQKIVADLRGPKDPFTVDYRCSKCKKDGIKLWRQYQTFADNIELECAACAAPGVEVDEKGTCESKHGGRTDQIGSWMVPAIPTGDTYWGYTSVPSQDVEWWVALPTYPPK